jgi:hypothetical protein
MSMSRNGIVSSETLCASGDAKERSVCAQRRIVRTTRPFGQEKGETQMNKAQVIGIAAGVTVGLLGVAVGVALAREEGREAARKMLAQSGDLAQKGQQRAVDFSQRVRTNTIPNLQGRLNTIISSSSPAEALNSALASAGLNGKAETVQQ